jgi:hypothetical protein
LLKAELSCDVGDDELVAREGVRVDEADGEAANALVVDGLEIGADLCLI